MGFGFPSTVQSDNKGQIQKPQLSHVHKYSVRTTFDAGHTHVVAGTTGPTIRTGFTHVHLMRGTTTFNDGHVHYYRTYTGPSIPTGPNTHTHKFFGVTTVNGRPPHVHRYSGVTAPETNDVYKL